MALRTHRWLPKEARRQASTPAPLALNTQGQQAADGTLFFWLGAGLELIKKYRLNPLRAARVLAYLMTALHDTAVSCNAVNADAPAHCAVAMNFTAGTVLGYFFPEEGQGRWRGEAILRASPYRRDVGPEWDALWQLSDQVSQSAVIQALTDGSARINALAQPPASTVLAWQATPPLWSTRPVEPGAASWRNWLVPAAIGEQCRPPLTLNPPAYRREIETVYQTHRQLTTAQKELAETWNLDLGTVTPPGVWALKTLENAGFKQLSAIEQSSVLSLLTCVMMDAFTACWYVKFKWWTERPVTAIRRLIDPEFMPLILTPSFPSFVSGHASVSGAAAGVLSALLPQDKAQWETEAEAAAVSRLVGGIHFRFDNAEGLALGQKVAALAISKFAY